MMSLVFLEKWTWAQILVGIFTSQFMLIWLLSIRPYQENKIEFANEFLIFTVFTLMMSFKWDGGTHESVDYFMFRKNIGFVMVSLVAIVLALNLYLTLRDLIISLYRLIRKFCLF
jgi:hypothetical protein